MRKFAQNITSIPATIPVPHTCDLEVVDVPDTEIARKAAGFRACFKSTLPMRSNLSALPCSVWAAWGTDRPLTIAQQQGPSRLPLAPLVVRGPGAHAVRRPGWARKNGAKWRFPGGAEGAISAAWAAVSQHKSLIWLLLCRRAFLTPEGKKNVGRHFPERIDGERQKGP